MTYTRTAGTGKSMLGRQDTDNASLFNKTPRLFPANCLIVEIMTTISGGFKRELNLNTGHRTATSDGPRFPVICLIKPHLGCSPSISL